MKFEVQQSLASNFSPKDIHLYRKAKPSLDIEASKVPILRLSKQWPFLQERDPTCYWSVSKLRQSGLADIDKPDQHSYAKIHTSEFQVCEVGGRPLVAYCLSPF